MQSDWPTVPLERVTVNYDTKRKPVKEADRRPGPYPYYGASGIVDHVDGFLFDGEYLLIAEDGENLRTRNTPIAFRATGRFWVNNHAHIVQGNELARTRFLEYAILAADISPFLTGAVMPKLTQGNLNKIPVACPPLNVQDAVINILGRIDDRIDLLRQTNATLESIAQALFKCWFVDFDPVRAKAEGREPEGMDAATAALFPTELEESALGLIPKGWGVSRLGDMLELPYGKALKATDRRDGNVPVYGSGGIAGFHDKALVSHGSIIVGRKGTVGSLYWEDRPFFPIDTTYYVRPKTAPLTFCYYAMQQLGLESMNTDAAVPGLNRENAYRLEVIAPPESVKAAFDSIASALRRSLQVNSNRTETLANIRDALLPRLISGKLRLPEVEARMEEAIA